MQFPSKWVISEAECRSGILKRRSPLPRHRDNEKQVKEIDRERDRDSFRQTYVQKEREIEKISGVTKRPPTGRTDEGKDEGRKGSAGAGG